VTESVAARPPFWSFALQVVPVAAAVWAAGWWLAAGAPVGTREAITAGVVAALAASLVGGVVGRGLAPAGVVAALFGAMGVRLGCAVLLGTIAALSGRWAIVPLLLALAITHLVLLVPDSLDAVRLTRQR
jgi:hypothetical protein